MILKVLFIPKDVYYRRDYVFKTFLSSEGTLYRIGTR